MNRLLTLIGAVVMLVSFTPGSALAVSDTATVKVTVTVLPYAEVRFDNDTLLIELDKRGSGKSHAKGQVLCNCPVILTAAVYPPAGATGEWKATTVPGTIEPGKHEYKDLLTISVKGTPGDTFSLELVNSTLEAPPLEQGQAIVTVVAQM